MTVSLRNTPLLVSSLGVTTFSITGSYNGTTPVAKDLLVAVQTLSGNGTTVLGTTPTGWLLSSINESATDVRTAIYTKIAVGGDAAPVFAGSITSGTAADCGSTVVLYDFSDSTGKTPVLTTAGVAVGTTGTVAPVTSGAAVVGGSYAIAALAGYATTAGTFTWTTPSGWATQGKSAASTHYQYAHWSLSAPTAGATLTCSMAHSAGASVEEAAFVAVIAPPGIYHVGDSTAVNAALSGTTQSNTYTTKAPISSGSGNALVAYASGYITGNNPLSLSSVTDTASNSWTVENGGSGYYATDNYLGAAAMAFCANAAAITSVTITWSAIPSTNSFLQVSEFVGMPTGAALDGSGQNSYAGTATSSLATASITPTSYTDLIISVYAGLAEWPSVTPGTLLNNGLSSWQIVSAPGVSNADTYSGTSNQASGTLIVAIGIPTKKSSDSGTGADSGAPIVNQTVYGTDSGSGVDSYGYDAYGTGTANDSGIYGSALYANYFYIQFTVPDSGTGVDTGTVTHETIFSTDSGSGVDTQSVNMGATVISSSDSGTGAEGTSYSVLVNSTGEAGSGSDTGLPNATLAGVDTGTGAESWAIYVYNSDTGSGQDTSPNETDRIFGVDAGTGIENWSIYVYSLDAGTGVESYGVEIDTVFGVDAGTGAEGPIVIKVNSADSGSGAETVPALVASISSLDAGSGAETVPALVASISSLDAGSGVETVSTLTASIGATDSGTGAEGVYVIGAGTTETGAGSDSGLPNATLAASDSGTGVDVAQLTASLSDFDFAMGSEAGLNLLSANDSTFATSTGSWQVQGNCTMARDATQGYDTPDSLQVTGTSTASAANGVYETAYNVVPTGIQFQISLWAKTSYTGQTIALYAYTYSTPTGGTETSLTSGAFSLPGDGAWHYFSYVFTQPVARVSALVSTKYAGLATGQTVNIDDVKIQVFPESIAATLSAADSGAGVESTGIIATLSTFDGGSGADLALPVQASVSDSDTSTGVESGLSAASLTNSDAGSGSESPAYVIVVNSSDSGSGDDEGSLINTGSNISSNDTGSGVDAGYVGSETIADVDSGTGVDSMSLAGLPVDVDAGSGDDEGSVGTEDIFAVDFGHGVEVVPALIVSVSGTESGTGAETSILSDAMSDSGTGVESQSTTATMQDADTGTGVEGWTVYLYSSDTGSGVETTSPVLAHVSITDLGTGADVSLSVPATLSAAESGFGDLIEAVLVGVNDAVGMP